ncbi:DUF397 domain-containing protein [Streptomyces sp. NPDC048504]|uniref:DUF397 domain-containing protein n=1 Tax=Streptomyces sp. NPDC048504 TaxID=3365559 RepID=UPI00371AA75F
MTDERGAVSWRRSSYSGNSEGQCCEVAMSREGIRVRDSKRSDAAVVSFTHSAWRSALALFLAQGRTAAEP